MISLKDVLYIHKQAISKFGGTVGVRNYDLLESAIKRPYMTFDKMELYPNIEDKASAILESIVKNHPFIDGNKRTGYILMRYLLLESGRDIQASKNEKYELVIGVAEGKISFEEIQNWIKNRIIQL